MLVNDIEHKRQQLAKIIDKYGLSSKHTLKCSQELDRLIKVYQQEKYTQMSRSIKAPTSSK